jgi:hypothetical protein
MQANSREVTMNVGMLWLDDDKGLTLEDKVRRAAEYYQHKYGRQPDLCLVSKTSLEDEQRVDLIRVRPAQNILPNHFWLGISPN